MRYLPSKVPLISLLLLLPFLKTTTGLEQQGLGSLGEEGPIDFLLAKNYRQYLPNNSTSLCDAACNDGDDDINNTSSSNPCMVTYGFIPAGVCLTAFVRNQSTTFLVEPDTGAVCQRLFTDRTCQTINTQVPFEESNSSQCHYRWEPQSSSSETATTTTSCNRATKYTILRDFCIHSDNTNNGPVGNYTVPIVETENHPSFDSCRLARGVNDDDDEGVGGPANAYRFDHPNLCQPTVVDTMTVTPQEDYNFSKQPGSMIQQCRANRLETTYYIDQQCSNTTTTTTFSTTNETLTLPFLSHGGCQQHPLFPNVYSATDCANTPAKYYCQDLSKHGLTKDIFTTTTINKNNNEVMMSQEEAEAEALVEEREPQEEEEEEDHAAMDLYVRANWYSSNINSSNATKCMDCTESVADGSSSSCLLHSFQFYLEGRCVQTMNEPTSYRYYTVMDAAKTTSEQQQKPMVCQIHYKDRDCTEEDHQKNTANRNKGGCHFLTTPNTCSSSNSNSKKSAEISANGEQETSEAAAGADSAALKNDDKDDDEDDTIPSPSMTTRLPNHCIYSTEPRGKFTQPMIIIRQYSTMEACQNATSASASSTLFGEFLTLPDTNSCREQAVETIDGDFIPGSVRFFCSNTNTNTNQNQDGSGGDRRQIPVHSSSTSYSATLERYANKQCTMENRDILWSTKLQYNDASSASSSSSSSPLPSNPEDTTTTTTITTKSGDRGLACNKIVDFYYIRTLDCESPQFFCKDNSILNDAVPSFHAYPEDVLKDGLNAYANKPPH